MNEEQMYPEEHERRKLNMRPDALVIPEDVIRLLRIPRREWTPELKARIQEHINRAKDTLFPDEKLENVPWCFTNRLPTKWPLLRLSSRLPMIESGRYSFRR